MSLHHAALSGTAIPRSGPGRPALAGLTLAVQGGLVGPAVRATQDLLAAGATLLDRSAPTDPVVVLRDGGCDVVLASDQDGLLRRNAGRFGLVGFRMGSVASLDEPGSLEGWGWLARDVADFGRIAEILLPEPALSLPEAPRCVIAADTLARLDHDIRAVLAPVIEELEDLFGRAEMAEIAPAGLASLVFAYRQLRCDGIASRSQEADGPVPSFGSDVRDDDDRDEAMAVRAALAARLRRLLAGDGLLLLPTLPDADADNAVGTHGEDGVTSFLCPAALAGLPQVSLPLVQLGEAPIGLSLLGPAGSDLSLCRVAVRIGRELGPATA